MPALRDRLATLIADLERGLIERGTGVRLALLAALSGEHLLLIGPPGTAKSELARRLHRALADGQYFERLLTRFSVPEEIFGPLSISALEEDRYERRIEGYLPTASIAFIDEVFKANSAILNALLTLLNEREFDNGATRIACPLVTVIGASNEVPDDEVTAAFFDRFLIRLHLGPVSREGFQTLITHAAEDGIVIHEHALTLREMYSIRECASGVLLPEDVRELLSALRDHLVDADIYVSDRRWRKVVTLLRVAAWCEGRDRVSVWDGWLLQFCVAGNAAQAAQVAEWYARRLGVFELLDPVRFRRVVEGFEAQLEIEQNAGDLNYGADGKLSMFEGLTDGKRSEEALRMPAFTRKRRYGRAHVEARANQVRQLLAEADDYLGRLEGVRSELAAGACKWLWIDHGFVEVADRQLAASGELVAGLRQRLELVRQGFLALPGLSPADEASGAGSVPEPMATG